MNDTWRERLAKLYRDPTLGVAFAIFTACAAVAYCAGYRDGPERCS